MKGGGPGTLFVVATPIGNLEDITLRALRVLREVAVVAAEDTRRTGNLLRHFEITTPLLSLHQHNEHGRVPSVLRRLEAGDSIALVSDAGTPGISDPGAKLVRAARQAGFRVDPIPGPSALTAALSAAGLNADRFLFAGFPPVRLKDRIRWLQWVTEHTDVPVVCFEAPHRLSKTLKDLSILGERPIILAKELTKVHETWTEGPVHRVEAPPGEVRGEFVIIISPGSGGGEAGVLPSDSDVASLFGQLAKNAPGTRKDAIRAVAAKLGMSPKAVFAALERARISVK
jgi:16S rRNA (cytidine1402-2'-O)-methyltransferase